MKKTTVCRLLCIIFALTLTVSALCSCNTGGKEKAIFSDRSDFAGHTFAALTGSNYGTILQDAVKGTKIKYYDDYSTQLSALEKKEIDGIIIDRATVDMMMKEESGCALYPETISSLDVAFYFKKGNPLKDEFDSAIAELTQDGTVARLTEKWVFGSDEERTIDKKAYDLSGKNGTLSYYCFAEADPLSYISENTVSGLEIEMIYCICRRLGYNVNIVNAKLDGILAALSGGIADFIGGSLAVTDERTEQFDRCKSFFTTDIVMLCRKESIAVKRTEMELNSPERTVAMTTDVPQDVIKAFSKAKIIYVKNAADGLLAVRRHQADAVLDQPQTYEGAVYEGATDLALHSMGVIDTLDIAAAVSGKSSIPDAKGLIDRFITEIRSNGVFDDMHRRWEVEKKYDMPKIEPAKDPSFTIKVGTTGLAFPYSYFAEGGEVTGMEIELAYRFAAWAGADIEFSLYDWDAIVSACETGRIDYAITNLYVTEERGEAIEYSVPYNSFNMVAIVLADNAEESRETFFESVKNSFIKTFIKENRWEMIAKGLLTTLIITVLSSVFGTVLALFICIRRRRGGKFSKAFWEGFCSLISGIPALVLLMVMFFIVLAFAKVSAEFASVVTFTLLIAVSVSGIFKTGLDSLDNGQFEAASALGFNHGETMRYITFPQAFANILPLYIGEIVSMMKLTSIVGYISVQDLTKAGDIIRSRTYEAFFPLICIAAVYFILARLLILLLGLVQKKLLPENKSHPLLDGVDVSKTCDDYADEPSAYNDGDELVKIEHVKKAYRSVTPLLDVNASLGKGDVITIIGPSGTGKSTLLRMINRMETATEGSVTVLGENVMSDKTDMCRLRRKVGMVFQSFNLFPNMNVIENVMLAPVKLLKMQKQEAYERGMKLLAKVGMAERANDFPSALSGGQKQRVAIVRALAMNPEILLLDEPTSALDPSMVSEVLKVIKDLAHDGLTMAIVTHEMAFAREVSTRIFYLDQGQVYEEGSPEEIFENPKRNRTRVFVRRIMSLSMTVGSEYYDFIGMTGKLCDYCARYRLSKQAENGLCLCFEEVCAIPGMIPGSDGEHKLHVIAEYDEKDGKLCIYFIREREEYDPLEHADEIRKKLIGGVAENIEFRYENGKNELKITVRQ